MNNKGFMMAEVVVVSSVVLVTLVALYASYSKILSAYNQRVNYYDVTTLYNLADVRDTTDFVGVTSISEIKNDEYNTVYYLNKSDIDELKGMVGNQTFKDYLEYIKDAATFDKDTILVMERCIDVDNCKYAYLEVFE